VQLDRLINSSPNKTLKELMLYFTWEKYKQRTRMYKLPMTLGVQVSKLGAATQMEYWVPALNQTPIHPQELQIYHSAKTKQCRRSWQIGKKSEGKYKLDALVTYPIMNALPKLFVFSLRKYMQAAKEIATCSSNTIVLSTSKYSCHGASGKRRGRERQSNDI